MADYDSWEVAGYGLRDKWHDVEGGDREPFKKDIPFVDEWVISVRDSSGVDHYYTIFGPFDDYDAIETYIDIEIMSQYAKDFA